MVLVDKSKDGGKSAVVEGHYTTGREEVGGVSIFRYLTSEIRSNQSSPDLMSTHYSYLLSTVFQGGTMLSSTCCTDASA